MDPLAYGGLAEQAVAKEAETFGVPEGMPFEEAGAFPIAYISSHVAIQRRLGLGQPDPRGSFCTRGGLGYTHAALPSEPFGSG